MKIKYLIGIVIFIGSFRNLPAQISSDKKTITFNNAPELIIENIRFTDENQDQKADPGETCKLTFLIKNTGKSKAQTVKIITEGPDSIHDYFSFEYAYSVGNILAGESKEVQIPMTAMSGFKSPRVSFNIVANEANNFNSKPVLYSISVKRSEILESFSWHYPDKEEIQVSKSPILLKACFHSVKPITELTLYKNDKVVSLERGFKLRKSGECEQYFEQEIKLDEGNNLIQIKARINKMTVESEVRNLIFKKPEYEKRLALVIGNANYIAAPLRNPVNDAILISTELKSAGFTVITIKNGSQNQMKQAISDFGEKLAKDKNMVGLFYYAGHGIQMRGKNYLVPVDARITKEPDVEVFCVDLDGLLANLEYSGNRLNIIILDACRNNPYARSFRSQASNGLATVNAPAGTFIAYATSPGSVAADGDGNNGLYTQEFVKAMTIPNSKIEDVFKKVRTNVKKMSDGQQIPWENSSIEGDFYFIK